MIPGVLDFVNISTAYPNDASSDLRSCGPLTPLDIQLFLYLHNK